MEEVSIEIDRSPSDVFTFLADIDNNRLWQEGVSWSRWTTDTPWELGALYEQAAPAWGGEVTVAHEVTQYLDGERMGVEWRANRLDFAASTTVAAAGAATKVTQTVAIRPVPTRGIIRWLNPTFGLQVKLLGRGMARRTRKRMHVDLQRLQRFLEA